MNNNKLVSLLKTFTKYELNSFRKYISSPFFNENQDLVRFYDLLQKGLRQSAREKGQELEKSVLWSRLFPGQPYQDIRLRRLSSDLTALAQGFLAYKRFAQDPLQGRLQLLAAFAKPETERFYREVSEAVRLALQAGQPRTAAFHYHLFQLEAWHHRFMEHTKGSWQETLGSLERSDYHLDSFYFACKLKHYCDHLGYRSISAQPPAIHLMPALLEYVAASPYIEEPLIRAYYLVASMLLEPDDESHFRQLKAFLAAQPGAFSRNELSELYTHLRNYCITQKINAGREDYYKELFDIFRALLDEELVLEDGVLNPQIYKNIITVGLNVNEPDWVEEFIHRYTPLLPPEEQVNAVNYNLAKVYFHQLRYDKVIGQLREVEYHNPGYALGSKLMLLRTYYELREFTALESLVDSFRIFLQRNRFISKEVKQQYLNVLRFTRRLSNLQHGDVAALPALRDDIRDCPSVAAKQWLLEKVAELEGGGGRG